VKRHWRWLTGWAALTVLVVLAAGLVEWRTALGAVATADPFRLVLAVVCNGTILGLATLQWLLFVPAGRHVPPTRMFSIVALTSSVSNGGPTLAGHATGIHLLATRGGLGHAGGVSLTILDQVAEGLAKWSLVALAAAVVPGFEYRTVGLTVVLGAPVLALAVAVVANRGHLVHGPASESAGWFGAALRFLSRTVHHLEALRRPRLFAGGVALALLQKVMEGLAILAVAAALGITLPAWVVLATVVALNLSTLVSLTPANLGVYEGAAFMVLRAGGLDADAALALAMASHAAYLIPLGGTGWIIESAGLWNRMRAR
jgi:uncharacterized membrane protein YbhN (UPF0104 family)